MEFYAPWCGHCKVRTRAGAARGMRGAGRQLRAGPTARSGGCWRPLGVALNRVHPRSLPLAPPLPPAPQTLKPKYAKAATAIKAYNADILVAKVDATEEKELGTKYEVQGYPTLKWFVDGKASEYAGGRET